ncbi:LOW QUALITY PROTEIN: trinucleotide repeat-containing gene 6C protein-like [Ptychodera flava]|uniref:LOW QUALITY PROTEIN: trinucleotide repeat-containing gene 6C protein-like n=1 Tax=Ptychodera flava TaxID=63121 RepID=UPI00396A4B1B
MSQEKESSYEVLGLEPNASQIDITRAYGRLALQYHPDQSDNKNLDEDSLTKYQEITAAYKNLIPDNDYKDLDSEQVFFRVFEDVLLCKKSDIGVFVFFAAGQKHSSYEDMSMYIDDDDEEDAGEKEFDSFVQIIKNSRSKGKPVPDQFTKEKLDKLREVLIREREALKLDKAKKQSGKKSKPLSVPVSKPKQKSKKQLKAEQRRREKEMLEIANDLKQKAKVDQEKLGKRKQAEQEKQKRLEEEKQKQLEEERKRKERESELKAQKDAEEKRRIEILERESERQLDMEEEAERRKQHELKKKEKEKLKKKEAEAKKLAEQKAKAEAEQAKAQAAKRQQQQSQQQQQQSRYPREVPPRFQQQAQKNQLKKDQPPKTGQQQQTQPNNNKKMDDRMETEVNDFSAWNDSNGGGAWNQVVVDEKDQEAWPAITREIETAMMVDNDDDAIKSGNNPESGSALNFDSNSKVNSISNVPGQVNHMGHSLAEAQSRGSNDISQGQSSGVTGSANSSTSANAMNFSDWSATSSSGSSTWGATSTSLSSSLNPLPVDSSQSKQGTEGAGEMNSLNMNSGWGAIGSSANPHSVPSSVANMRGLSPSDLGGVTSSQLNSIGSNPTISGSWTAVVGGRGLNKSPQSPNPMSSAPAQIGSMTQATSSTGNGPNHSFTQAAMQTSGLPLNPVSQTSLSSGSGWGTLPSEGQGLSFTAGSGNPFPTGANPKSTNPVWNMPSSGFPSHSADKPGNFTADRAANNVADAANGSETWQGSGSWSTTSTGKLSPSSSQNWGTPNSSINSNPGSANEWGKPQGAGSNPHGWGNNASNPSKSGNPNGHSNPTTPTVGQAWGGNQVNSAWGAPSTPTQTSTSGWGGGATTASTENSWAKTASKGIVQETRKEETPKSNLDAIIQEAIDSHEGWGRIPVKQNASWNIDTDPSPPPSKVESNTWEPTPAHDKTGTQAWGASRKNEDSGSSWGGKPANNGDNGNNSGSGTWGNAETGEWNSSNHWNSGKSNHDVTGTGVWAKNTANKEAASSNNSNWHGQRQSTNPQEEMNSVWRSNSSNTQARTDSSSNAGWGGSTNNSSWGNPSQGHQTSTPASSVDTGKSSWGNANNAGTSSWGNAATTPTTPKTPSQITGSGWNTPLEVPTDIKATGWDEPSPPTSRKHPQVDDGTSAWGDPSEHNAKAVMQSNWTNPPPSPGNSTMQSQSMMGGPSSGQIMGGQSSSGQMMGAQQPMRPAMPTPQVKPDEHRGVWGAPPPTPTSMTKMSSWGDPPPANNNNKVDDGTSAWKSSAQHRGSVSNWGEPQSDMTWNNGTQSKESMQDGWSDQQQQQQLQQPSNTVGHWDDDRWEKGSQDSESSKSSGGGWIKVKPKGAKPPQPVKDVNTAWMSKQLKQLMDMGFKRELAETALKANNFDVASAVGELTAQEPTNKQAFEAMERHRRESLHSLHQGSDPSTPSTPLNKEMENLSLSDNQTQENKSFLPIGDNQQSIPSSIALSPSSTLPNHMQLNQQQLPFNKPGVNQGMLSSTSIANTSITSQYTQQQQQLQQRLATLQQQQLLQQQQQQQQQQSQQQQQQQGMRNMVPNQQMLQQQQQQQLMMQQVQQLLRVAVQAGLIQPGMLQQQVTPQQILMVQQLFQMHVNYQKLLQQQQQVLQQQGQNPQGGKAGINIPPQRQQELAIRISNMQQQMLQQQRQLNQQHLLQQQNKSWRPLKATACPVALMGSGASDVNQDLGPKESRLQQFFNKQSNKPSDIFGSQFRNDHQETNPSIHTSQSLPSLSDRWSRSNSPGPLDPPLSSAADTGSSDWPPNTSPNVNMPTTIPSDLPPEFKPGVPWKYRTKDVENDPDATPGSVSQSILSIGLGTSLSSSNMSINRTTSREDLAQRENEIRGLLTKPMQPPSSSSATATPSWSAPPYPSSNKQKSTWSYPENYNPSYPPTTLTAALWHVPLKPTNAPSRPPPGLTTQPKSSWSSGGGSNSGISRSMSWDPTATSTITTNTRSSAPFTSGETGKGYSGSSSWGSDQVQDAPSAWLVLRNLTPQIDGSTLQTLCKQHGPLHTFHLNLNQGQAWIQYGTREEAAKAQKALHMCVLGNTTIMAEFTSPELARPFERNNQSSGWPQSLGNGNKFNSGSISSFSNKDSLGSQSWNGSTTSINLPSMPGSQLWSMQSTPTSSSSWGRSGGDSGHISSPTSMNFLPENLLGEGSV